MRNSRTFGRLESDGRKQPISTQTAVVCTTTFYATQCSSVAWLRFLVPGAEAMKGAPYRFFRGGERTGLENKMLGSGIPSK